MTLNDAQNLSVQLEPNENDLYGFLNNLLYNTPDPLIYIPIFEKYLNDKRPDINEKSIDALLFTLQIQNEVYKNAAIKFLSKPTTDYNEGLKSFSAVSLGAAYKGTKDEKSIRALQGLFLNSYEPEPLRISCLHGMLTIYFSYNSHQMFIIREKSLDASLSEILPLYEKELAEITAFLQGSRKMEI